MLDPDCSEDDDDKDLMMEIDLETGEVMTEAKLKELRDRKKVRIPIHTDELNALKVAAKNHNYPLIEEYDFKRDTKTADLKIELKPNTLVRDY